MAAEGLTAPCTEKTRRPEPPATRPARPAQAFPHPQFPNLLSPLSPENHTPRAGPGGRASPGHWTQGPPFPAHRWKGNVKKPPALGTVWPDRRLASDLPPPPGVPCNDSPGCGPQPKADGITRTKARGRGWRQTPWNLGSQDASGRLPPPAP